MNAETTKPLFRWTCFFCGMAVVASLITFDATSEKSASVSGSVRLPSDQKGKISVHVFDRLPMKGVLLSRTLGVKDRPAPDEPLHGDLWFQDNEGRERHLANGVVRASFSPDGKKLVYVTSDRDLFIETMEGKPLAQLARVQDYSWSSDSMAVTFSAVASEDYPEMQQSVIYDLASGKMIGLSEAR